MSKSADAFRTISEVADWLGVQAHVLRFWESKFTQIKPVKRAGGRRYYRPADMLLLGGIRKLLHQDGLSIKEVQAILRDHGISHVSDMSHDLDADGPEEDNAAAPVTAHPKADNSAPPADVMPNAPVSQRDPDPEIEIAPQVPLDAAPAPESVQNDIPPQALDSEGATKVPEVEAADPDPLLDEGPLTGEIQTSPTDEGTLPDTSMIEETPANPALAEVKAAETAPSDPEITSALDSADSAPEQVALSDTPPPLTATPVEAAPSAAAEPPVEDVEQEEPQQMHMELDAPGASPTPEPAAPVQASAEQLPAESSGPAPIAPTPATEAASLGEDTPAEIEIPSPAPAAATPTAPAAPMSAPGSEAAQTAPALDIDQPASVSSSPQEPPVEPPVAQPTAAEATTESLPFSETEPAAETAPPMPADFEAAIPDAAPDAPALETPVAPIEDDATPKPRALDIPDEQDSIAPNNAQGVLALLARTSSLPAHIKTDVADCASQLRAILAAD